jgi:hypothetical protein
MSVVLPLPREAQGRGEFALPPKGVNVVEMLGEQHRQYDAVCDVVIYQPNYWLEDEIRAECVIHYGPVAYASSSYVCHCWLSGQMTDRTLPVMIKNVDGAF